MIGYLATVVAVVAFGLLMFAYRYLDAVAVGGTWPWQEPLINEMTGVVGGALLLPLVARVVRARPFVMRPVVVTALIHVGALLVFSVSHTTWNWASRTVLYPLAGLRSYDYGDLPARYAMELSVDILLYAGCAGFVILFDRHRAQQAAVLRAARLEEALARAEVQQIQLQLQPHFLFNTLNTIAATMYEDVEAAERMLTELADLLRLSLDTARTAEVPFATELDLVERYAALMTARFGDRLVITQDIDEATLPLLVPALLLQPLVENAIRHGRLTSEGAARITIRARRTPEGLSLEVSDDGGGRDVVSASSGTGLGLSAVRRRLDLLHGAAATFSAGHAADGFVVSLTLPAREAC